MNDFIQAVFSSDYHELFGDYYGYAVGGVGVCFAILAFAGAVEGFKLLFTAIVNIRR